VHSGEVPPLIAVAFAEMLALRRADASALSSELAAIAMSWSVLR
jgi:hypothetical protein